MRQQRICILAAIAVVLIGLGLVVAVLLIQSSVQSSASSSSQGAEEEEWLEEESDVSLMSITIFLPEIAKAYMGDLSAPPLPGIDLRGYAPQEDTAHGVEK